VIDGLIVGELVRLREKAVPSFRKDHNSQGLLLRDFNGLVGEERLPPKSANVLFHPFAIPAVGMLCEVCHGDHPELADFLQGVHLGIAEEIRAITDVIRAWGSTPYVAGGMLFPSFGAVVTARGLRRGIPTVSCIGRCCSVLTDGATRGGVARLAGVLRIVGKGVARH
jgi:hypothetical protein